MNIIKISRIVLSLCVLLTISHACLGQRRKGAKAGGRKPESPIVVSAPVPGGYFKKVGQANVSYLPGLGITTAHVHFSDVYRREKLSLSLSASIDAHGDRIVNPEFVTLRVFHPQHEPAFAEAPELGVETDGEWHDFGETMRDQTELIDFVNGGVSGAVAKEIDLQSFERIAGSKRVRMRVGKIEFALNRRQLAALRDLLKTIEP
jgi:hypothetical protein